MVAVATLVGSAALRWLPNGFAEPQAVAAEPRQFSPYVDEMGNITLPIDYKTTFTHLGTFATASKVGGTVDQLHGVYARPKDIEAYQKDGKFPDGAVVVKDVYKVKSDTLTTGTVTWATDIDIWFVMVKDTKGRFKENDLWGDGWGWALFEGTDPGKQVATDYSSDCRACHVPAKKDDWLYVRGYPVLGGERETQ
jgi:hypothetical protein